MNAHDRETLNRRNRMTPEERHEDIVRETMGPVFDAFFRPASPECLGCREGYNPDGSPRIVCCQELP